MCRHRNPLFSELTGVTANRCAALDWLHTLSLGVFQTYSCYALHMFVRADAWRTLAATESTRMELTVSRLSTDISRWQKLQQRRGRQIKELGNMKAEMFGTFTRPKFGLKAAETNWFLEYLVTVCIPSFLPSLGDTEQFRTILAAGQDLMSILTLFRDSPITFRAAEVQQFHDASKSYLRTMHSLGVRPKPKDHMLMELSYGCRYLGSPALYANWADESLNRLLRDVAAGAHSAVHEKRILKEAPRALELEAKRHRR